MREAFRVLQSASTLKISVRGFHVRSGSQMTKTTYENVGMHVAEADAFAEWIGESTPKSSLVLDGVGGFASICRLPFEKYEKPCVVTCTDGVGTKVLIASELNDLSRIGQDLVGMCVNDLICTGGDPYFFLDYYAVGSFDKKTAQDFLKSVRSACEMSNCDLVGGETAEMPGVYQKAHFDCAGFAVGLVDEDKRWGKHLVQEGDILVGLASSGFHSNGYSLIRKTFEGEWTEYKEWLLEPTRLYVKPIQDAKSHFTIHGAAHITGGGLDNIPRILNNHLCAKIKMWELPENFKEVQKRTGLTLQEMLTTLNCGIGFVLAIPASEKEKALAWGQKWGLAPQIIGVIEKSKTSNGNEGTWELIP